MSGWNAESDRSLSFINTLTKSTQARRLTTKGHDRSTVSNALYTNTLMVVKKNSRSRFLRLVFAVRFVVKQQVSVETSIGTWMPARNTLVQLLALLQP